MGGKKIWECAFNVISCVCRVVISFHQLFLAWVSVAHMLAVDIVSFVIMDFHSVYLHKLTRSWLRILASNPPDHMDRPADLSTQNCLAFLHEANFL